MRNQSLVGRRVFVVMLACVLLWTGVDACGANPPAARKQAPARKRQVAAETPPARPSATAAVEPVQTDKPALTSQDEGPGTARKAPVAPVAASRAVVSQPQMAPSVPSGAAGSAMDSPPAVRAHPATRPDDSPAGKASVAPPSAPAKISIWQATVLGVVQGLTEFLPVSSTGHLILTGYWLGLTRQTDEPGVFGGHKLEKVPAIDSFEIVIQLGSILAVLGLYRKRVGQMVKGMAGRNAAGLRLAMLLIVAFLPAVVIGLALHKKIEEHLFGPMPVAVALAVGGVLMIVVEHCFWTRRRARLHEARQTRALVPIGAARVDSTGPMVYEKTTERGSSPFTRLETMMYWQALAIGLAQCLSMWPGTSRSMITILAALVVGLDMAAAAEFSFLLALPTLGAATLYSGAKHWNELMQSAGPAGLVVGLVVSGIVAALAVKGFVHWLTRHGLLPFGVYRILLALVLMSYFLG